MSQHSRIIELCKDGEWHCQTQFWAISKSPHKRRDDIHRHKTLAADKNYFYDFKERPCTHDIANGMKDYLLKITPIGRTETVQSLTKPTQSPLFPVQKTVNARMWIN